MSTFLDSARHRMQSVESQLRNRAPTAPGVPAPETLQDFTKRAAAAFEKDMQPVCNAMVAALQAGDVAALKGLRALLPHLLDQVNAQPALADLLAHQLGKSLLDGFAEDGTAEAQRRGEATEKP